jgi:predicted glycoside hydrolase/deacetylase ChbG (UPF0249 family)
MKRLVVTGDDLGLTSCVVAGIALAHERGILTSASLMVNAPASEEAFRLTKERPSLSVGLHFVLTLGRPVGPVAPIAPILSSEGSFNRLDLGTHEGIEPDDIRPELEAQLDRFIRETGRSPTHLDGHHHVHAVPAVLEAVIPLARSLSTPVRAPNQRVRDRLTEAGVGTTGRFIESFYGKGRISSAILIELLESLPDATHELMCHPATGSELLNEISDYSEERPMELETLIAAEVRDAINRTGIRLIPSSKLDSDAA